MMFPLELKNHPRRLKVIIALNASWNLVNFRSGLIRALVAEGYEVVAVAPEDSYSSQLTPLGCRYVPLPMDNNGTSPGKDLLLLWRFYVLLKRERPDAYLGYTVKPNVYGSLAAHFLNIPVINNIAGLGAVFINSSWLTRVVQNFYRLALRRSFKVFFQNADDEALFIEKKLVPSARTDRLPGSGIDLERFSLAPLPQGAPRFLLIGRMLWDKGVREFVEAARMLRARGVDAEFCLLGFLDVKNPTAISRETMDEWAREGVINYLGTTDDVRVAIATAHCVVLPSYREGTSRTLLEAAAMGRPLVTTDAAGCREVVDDGVNGYLCRIRDATHLAEKMEQIVLLGTAERAEMGRRGREKMEREFDERLVIGKYLKAVEAAVATADAR